MAVPAIGAAGVRGVGSALPAGGVSGAAPGKGAGSVDFAKGLESVQQSLNQADSLGQQLATGELTDIHQYMAAASKANLAVELTVAVRNRAVEAYQEIMRMQV